MKHFKILADVETTIKASISFNLEIEYFNSDIFKWEPFIENTCLELEYET